MKKLKAPDMVTPEEPKQIFIVVDNKKAKTKMIDYIKFGVGFYIGFKLARTAKNGIVKAVNALK